MSMYHKFYIKQMNFELEVVQPIYVQKITIFELVGAIEDVEFSVRMFEVFHALK